MPWEALKAIIEQAKVGRLESEAACPICGTPLDVNAKGQKNCPMGCYRTS